MQAVSEPTEWCDPLIFVAKPNGGIRLCVDLSILNANVVRGIFSISDVDTLP